MILVINLNYLIMEVSFLFPEDVLISLSEKG